MPYKITDLCNNCGECSLVCPLEAITAGEKRPKIDSDLCTDCGTCSDLCPERAIEGEG
ncbi:MAG: 4Fe-4S binding protein [Thermodesulfobacteriota bacterium]|nr:4Fe-4S binding protein [Thermodesulfobacteriota bacterium]